MKKIRNVIIIVLGFVLVTNTNILAHGGNITGWNNKDSKEITEYKGKYYGYHKQNEEIHYHQVEWNEEKQKWEITKTAVCYDENFNIINNIDDSDEERIKVKYNKSVDGDTAKFEVNGEIITVRFLGIDTPETVHPTKGEEPYGKEASNYTKEKLENASKIELEYDKKSSKTDKYGRPLVWVWVNDSLLQEELISNGLARTYMLKDSHKYAWLLQESQEKAQKEKVGIWSKEAQRQENIIIENIKNENVADNLIGLGVVVLLLMIVILLKLRKKKENEIENM